MRKEIWLVVSIRYRKSISWMRSALSSARQMIRESYANWHPEFIISHKQTGQRQVKPLSAPNKTSDVKKADFKVGFFIEQNFLTENSIPISTKNPQQRQQVREDIVDIEIDIQGSRNVISFTAIDNLLYVKQYVGRKNRNCNNRDCEMQCR